MVKRATTKRATTKRATTKRATTKKATTKKAVATKTKVATKRATTPKATTKKAKTYVQTRVVNADPSTDKKIVAKKAGVRTASKVSYIPMLVKDKKTGKKVLKNVRRKNATSHNGVYIRPKTGNKYIETRENRSDRGKYE